MYYTVYKITNKINNKYYIGKHQTKKLNDYYFGSGKLLKRAIEKHGKESFIKEILFVFDTEDQMNAKEKQLVVIDESSYNLCPGGNGGFGYINKNCHNNRGNHRKTGNYGFKKRGVPLDRKMLSDRTKQYIKIHGSHWLGRKHKRSTIEKMKLRPKQTGQLNSQFGTCWITNGTMNIKCSCSDINRWIDVGYKAGRTIKRKTL